MRRHKFTPVFLCFAFIVYISNACALACKAAALLALLTSEHRMKRDQER